MRKRALATAVLAGVLVLSGSSCKTPTFGNESGDSSSAPGVSAPTHSVLDTSHIQKDWRNEKFKPKAVVLHWQANDGSRGIEGLISDLNGTPTTFDSRLKSTDRHPVNGHTGVQIGVNLDGSASQLTPTLDTLARHATCANWWAIGIEIAGSEPGSGHYIGDNAKQFAGVVKVVKELMARYDIPAVSIVGPQAHSGRGIVSHKMVDAKCTWADGVRFGSGKTDVDDTYLRRIIAAVRD